MKKTANGKTDRLTLAILLFSMMVCRGQLAPANDNFTNRIFLTGNDISFDGTLNGATRESAPYEVVPPLEDGEGIKTVWWEWTASESTKAFIQISNPSKPMTNGLNAVAIYDLIDIWTGAMITHKVIDTSLPGGMFLMFQAEPGTNYQIQLAGSETVSFSFRLIATNLPQIVEQPQHQAISSNDSVMFGVVAAGLKPFSYQWQRNGTNLPGETAPILAFDHVVTSQAGDYRVIITNSTGMTVSDTANLLVTDTDPAALISIPQSESDDQLTFKLLGDAGRRYRIQSSSDLNNWLPESSFPSIIFRDAYQPEKPIRSMVINLTGADSLVVPLASQHRFYRAASFHAANEVCNNNLKQIRFAQLLHGYEFIHNDWGNAVTILEILPYLKNGELPACPSSGYYSVTTILNNPYCSVPNHILEER